MLALVVVVAVVFALHILVNNAGTAKTKTPEEILAEMLSKGFHLGKCRINFTERKIVCYLFEENGTVVRKVYRIRKFKTWLENLTVNTS